MSFRRWDRIGCSRRFFGRLVALLFPQPGVIPQLLVKIRAQGMITMDECLQQLYNNGEISRDTAIRFARDKVAQETRLM